MEHYKFKANSKFLSKINKKDGKIILLIYCCKVSVRFWSEKGISKWKQLDNWGNDFENGSLGKYFLEIEEIGTIEKIDIKLRISKRMSSVN